jgi:AcrR family transcriptional regulator
VSTVALGEATAGSSEAGSQPPGLRERSKARRRALIQRTAMILFAERGYQATTIADIAEAAEVAPRTVSGYFPSKVELATSFTDESTTRLIAAFAARPGADILAVVDAWLSGEAELLDRELATLAQRMYAANPELAAISSAHVAEAAELGIAAVADELGLPVEHPMVDICSAALGGALTSYLDAISRNGTGAELHQAVMAFLHGLIKAAKVS